MNEPTERKAEPRLLGALFALSGAALLLTQFGYTFERGDQLQYLLLPYRMIYPDFLPNDWFTWHTTHYHHAFAWIVVGLHAAFGEANFAWAMLGSHLAVLLALSYAIWRLSRAWGLGTLHAGVAIVLLATVREAGLAGDMLNHAQLLPSDMALPPFLLACANWLERRAFRTGAWLGLSGLLHANFAVLGPLVLLLPQAWLSMREKRPRELLICVAAYTPLAAPVLALVAHDFIIDDALRGAVLHMLRIRAPHHYELSAFAPEDFCWLGLLGISGLPTWLSTRWWRGRERNRWLVGGILAVLGFGLIGALFEIGLIMRLYVWRISIPLIVILLLVFAETALEFARSRHVTGLCWSLGCLAAMAAFARNDLSRITPPPFQHGWFAIPALLPLALLGAGLARGKLRRPSWLLVGLASPLWWVANALSQPLPKAHHEDEELSLMRGPRLGSFGVERGAHELFDRIREVTPEHASFLISPSLLGFRLHTRRAAYVDWKCAPMKGVEALEWERRMLAVLGLTEFPNFGYDLRTWSEERYNRRNLQLLGDLARRERLDFVIASRRSPPPASAGLEAYFAAGRWRVYRVRSLEEMRNMPAPAPPVFP